MDNLKTAVLVGAGNRANVYSSLALDCPDKLKIVGIVDPDPIRTELMRKRYNVPVENCFETVDDFVKREKFADVVINGTMDHLHVETSIPVLEKGYDLLLEKPFAVNEQEMNELFEVAKKHNNKVVIGHVLRYTDFYKSIKNCIMSGEIGRIISLEASELVSYHHMAVSFVRGKWRSEKLCFAPMLLAKCCHDIDIVLWLMNDTAPVSVASFGSDFQFGKENKPKCAGSRCMTDCAMADECIFSAKTNYLPYERWCQYVWKSLESDENLTPEKKEKSLKTDNPYGKCVWDFERDGNVDHQVVIINFANGATANFSMIGGCAMPDRQIHIIGTKGEIQGSFDKSEFVVRKADPTIESGYSETVYNLNVQGDKTGEKDGHGGGDRKLMTDFLDYVNGNEPSVSCATLADSVISHKTVFMADKARKTATIVKID